MQTRYLIFTDLDGTLLDHETYDYHDAQEVLLCIKKKNIPLIFCSSKTRREMEVFRREFENNDPFIVENGGAIFSPRGLLDLTEESHIEIGGYDVIELGTPYEKLIHSFRAIRAETGLNLLGFSEMSLEQAARSTGLSLGKAALAKEREYSEPFLIMEEETRISHFHLEQSVQKRDLRMTRGGRFYHLTGPNDKGRAVSLLKRWFQKKIGPLVSVGLGDSPNDFPMLENVEVPVLIKKKTDHLEPWTGSSPVYRPHEIGPRGWNAFMLQLLKEVCRE